MEGWRDGGVEGWRDEGMEGWTCRSRMQSTSSRHDPPSPARQLRGPPPPRRLCPRGPARQGRRRSRVSLHARPYGKCLCSPHALTPRWTGVPQASAALRKRGPCCFAQPQQTRCSDELSPGGPKTSRKLTTSCHAHTRVRCRKKGKTPLVTNTRTTSAGFKPVGEKAHKHSTQVSANTHTHR